MASRQRIDPLQERHRLDDRTEQQKSFNRVAREAAGNRFACKQSSQFGSEEQHAGDNRVVERLDAEAVARQKNSASVSAARTCIPAVPHSKCKHTVQMVYAAIAPLLVSVDDRFTITAGTKAMAEAFQFYAQLPKIIDLSITDDGNVTRFVIDRLGATGDIQNAEPA